MKLIVIRYSNVNGKSTDTWTIQLTRWFLPNNLWNINRLVLHDENNEEKRFLKIYKELILYKKSHIYILARQIKFDILVDNRWVKF